MKSFPNGSIEGRLITFLLFLRQRLCHAPEEGFKPKPLSNQRDPGLGLFPGVDASKEREFWIASTSDRVSELSILKDAATYRSIPFWSLERVKKDRLM